MTSTSDSEIIARQPIGHGLDSIKLRISESLGLSTEVEHLIEDLSFDHESLICHLICAIQDLPAARTLQSCNGGNTFHDDLRSMFSRITEQNYIPLLKHLINGSPDLDIWKAVFALAEQNPPIIPSKPTTPPKVCKSVNYGAPVTSNTSSRRGQEQKHSDIDGRMLEEIRDCTYNNAKGFYDKYFESRPWTPKVEKIVKAANPQKNDNRWSDYPDPPPDENNFSIWLRIFQQKFFKGQRGKYYQPKDVPLGGSDCHRKPDIFLAHPTKSGNKYKWQDIRVIGEHKKTESPSEYSKELVCLSEQAREIFISQPTRLFLHGFIIRGPTVELLVYDRSGPYSCERFNLHDEPEKFIKVMAGYTLMNDEDFVDVSHRRACNLIEGVHAKFRSSS